MFVISNRLKAFIALASLTILVTSAQAYGPIAVDENGAPLVHLNLTSTSPLVWNVEDGPLQDKEVANIFVNTSGGVDEQALENFCNTQQTPQPPFPPAPDTTSGSGSSGGSGCQLTPPAEVTIPNSDGASLVESAWSVWQAVPDANLSFKKGSTLGVNVNACNYTQFIDSARAGRGISSKSNPRICGCLGTCGSPCTNPIIFDANGDILALEAGEANRTLILGTAGPFAIAEVKHFLKMEAIINGACLEGAPNPDCGPPVSKDQIKGILVHELGHSLGLTHSQVNHQEITIDSVSGQASIDPSKSDFVPTMYPVIVNGADMATLHKDDSVGISHLYPKASLASNYCTANGFIFKGFKALRCAEVVLRPTDSATNKTGAISFISGSEVMNDGTPNVAACTEADQLRCGNYQVQGLEVGKTYTIEVNPVDSRFRGGSSVDPCDPPNTAVTAIGATGSITCSSGGVTFTCSGGANNDTDLCQTLAQSVTPPLKVKEAVAINSEKPFEFIRSNLTPLAFLSAMLLPLLGIGFKRWWSA